SGKSTLLRAIAGLDLPDTGSITINGRDVTHVPPQRRGIGFVFQHYASSKHLTVRDNVGFGLKIRKRPKAEIKEKLDNLLEVVGLSGFHGRYHNELSGPRRYRLAVFRAGVPINPPAASGSAWRWRARARWTRRFSCWTNRSARWTRRCAM